LINGPVYVLLFKKGVIDLFCAICFFLLLVELNLPLMVAYYAYTFLLIFGLVLLNAALEILLFFLIYFPALWHC